MDRAGRCWRTFQTLNAQAMSRLTLAIGQIQGARQYTLGLLEDVKPEDWFRQPSEGVTHVAWQVGHLAFAEHALALKRTRGERAEDDALFSNDFRPIV